MNRVLTSCLLLVVSVYTIVAVEAKGRGEIMGVSLGVSRETAQQRLKTIGSLEKEERKRQEDWAVNDPRVSHILIGYAPEYRVRYITAIARPGGPSIRYLEGVGVKRAQRSNY